MSTIQLLQKFNIFFRKYKEDKTAGVSIEFFEDGCCYLHEHGAKIHEDSGNWMECFNSILELNSFLSSFNSANDIRIHYLYAERE